MAQAIVDDRVRREVQGNARQLESKRVVAVLPRLQERFVKTSHASMELPLHAQVVASSVANLRQMAVNPKFVLGPLEAGNSPRLVQSARFGGTGDEIVTFESGCHRVNPPITDHVVLIGESHGIGGGRLGARIARIRTSPLT